MAIFSKTNLKILFCKLQLAPRDYHWKYSKKLACMQKLGSVGYEEVELWVFKIYQFFKNGYFQNLKIFYSQTGPLSGKWGRILSFVDTSIKFTKLEQIYKHDSVMSVGNQAESPLYTLRDIRSTSTSSSLHRDLFI